MVSEFTEAEPLGEVADAYKPGIPHRRADWRRCPLDRSGRRRAGRRARAPGPPHRRGRAVPAARRAVWPVWWRGCTRRWRLDTARDRPRRRLLVPRRSHRSRACGRPGRPAPPAEYAAAPSARRWLERGLRRAASTRPGSSSRSSPASAVYGNSRAAPGDGAEREAAVGAGAAHLGRLRQLGGAAQRPRLGARGWAADLRRRRWPGEPVDGRRDRRSCGFDTICRRTRRCRRRSPPATCSRSWPPAPTRRRWPETSTRCRGRPQCWSAAAAAELIRRPETAHDVAGRDLRARRGWRGRRRACWASITSR